MTSFFKFKILTHWECILVYIVRSRSYFCSSWPHKCPNISHWKVPLFSTDLRYHLYYILNSHVFESFSGHSILFQWSLYFIHHTIIFSWLRFYIVYKYLIGLVLPWAYLFLNFPGSFCFFIFHTNFRASLPGFQLEIHII